MTMQKIIQERFDLLRQVEQIKARLEGLDDQIFEQVQDRVKPQGSTTIKENGHKIVVSIPMRTTWDEDKLRSIADNIRQHGDDPEQYIQYKPTVPESKFKAWPEAIRKVFEPARTIKPGKRSIKVEKNK